MRFTVDGRRFTLSFPSRRPRNRGVLCDGLTTCAPGQPRTVKVWDGLEGEDRLNTILHELLHAAGWPLDEAFVEEYGTVAASVLWKLGYRNDRETMMARKAVKKARGVGRPKGGFAISLQDAAMIRQRKQNGENAKDLAAEFGVTTTTIYSILKGKTRTS